MIYSFGDLTEIKYIYRTFSELLWFYCGVCFSSHCTQAAKYTNADSYVYVFSIFLSSIETLQIHYERR